MVQATGLLYLKAAHSETAAVQPADITIYMGGTSGYEGVAEEDGTISGSNSLPESGYYITLSDSGLIHGNKSANLSEYIPLCTVGTEGERVWRFRQYGAT